jgi:hypothetical protein
MPHFATTQEKAPRQNATSVTPVHAGLLQRKCDCGGTAGPTGECEQCKKKRESNTNHSSEIPPIVHEVLSSAGQPLDTGTRAFMERRFGHDFRNVRVHTDAKAAESARAVRALAYTVGHDVVFDASRHSPETVDSRRLLGHELAHVVQQSVGVVSPNRRSEADAEAAATDLDRGRPARVAMGTRVGLARQPSSSTDDSDLYQAFIDIPQIEKDRLLSKFGAVAPEPEPKAAPVEDIGCHIDPNKKSPGQPKCAVSHHKTPGAAEQTVAAQMQHPVNVTQFEKEQRAKFDRLNEAFLYYKGTGKYIHRGEFSPYEIEKGNIIATSDRWDAWMKGRGVGINNLEAAEFDQRFFRSKAEFDRELRRRDEEYAAKLETCKKEGKGLKAPKLHRTRPEYLDCEEKVAAEYEPMMAAATAAAREWNSRQLPAIESIANAGPVSTAGLVVGGTARVLSGGESKEAVPSALALGSLGDALALGVGAPPLAGTAQDPGRAPSALVEKAPPREAMPPPPSAPSATPASQPAATPAVAPATPPTAVVVPTPALPPVPTPTPRTLPMRRTSKGPRPTTSSALHTTTPAKRLDPQIRVDVLPTSSTAFSDEAAASVTPNTPAPAPAARVRGNTQPFLRDQLAKVSNPSHPLHNALVVPVVDGNGNLVLDADGHPTFTWRTTTFTAKSGRVMTGRYQGNEHGIVVQVGHREAFASGAPEVFMLEDADANQLGGQVIESRGSLSNKVAVEVDGAIVDQFSLEQWERLGIVPAGTTAKAKKTQ